MSSRLEFDSSQTDILTRTYLVEVTTGGSIVQTIPLTSAPGNPINMPVAQWCVQRCFDLLLAAGQQVYCVQEWRERTR